MTHHPPPHPVGEAVTLAREDTPEGEVALRRRGEVLELVVDGAFAMDTVDVSTERLLARRALARHPAPAHVLVGGLGLGVTTRAVLADRRVELVDVVELAGPLVRWAREGLVPELAGLESARCRVHVGDVAAVLGAASDPSGPWDAASDPSGPWDAASDPSGPWDAASDPSGPWDVVLLDVDNGPGFLVHAANAGLYEAPGLASARAALAPGGVLVVWSSHVAPSLLAAMRSVAGDGDLVDEELLPVSREGRSLEYALYTLVRAPHP